MVKWKGFWTNCLVTGLLLTSGALLLKYEILIKLTSTSVSLWIQTIQQNQIACIIQQLLWSWIWNLWTEEKNDKWEILSDADRFLLSLFPSVRLHWLWLILSVKMGSDRSLTNMYIDIGNSSVPEGGGSLPSWQRWLLWALCLVCGLGYRSPWLCMSSLEGVRWDWAQRHGLLYCSMQDF